MKPTKNSHFCIDCNRRKMVFSSREKAERFIAYNADEIYEETGRRPIRAYFCVACGGWHVTSHEARPEKSSFVERYFAEKAELIELMASLKLRVWRKNTIYNSIAIHVGNFYHEVKREVVDFDSCEETVAKLLKLFEFISHTCIKHVKEIQKAFSKFVDGWSLLLERKKQVDVATA